MLSFLRKEKGTRGGLTCISRDPNAITLVQMKHQHKARPQLLQCTKVPYANVDDSDKVLAKLVRKSGVEGNECAYLLSESDYHLILQEKMAVPEDEMAEAVRWQLKGMLPFPPENALVDTFLVPNSKEARHCYVVAAPLMQIQSDVAWLKHAGLNTKIIDIREFALRNIATLLANSENDKVALLRIDQTGSLAVIVGDGNLHMARNLPVKSQENGMDANTVKTQIEQFFSFYQQQFHQFVPQKLYVSTSSADSSALVSDLDAALECKVSELNLADLLQIPSGMEAALLNQSIYPIGAALRTGE